VPTCMNYELLIVMNAKRVNWVENDPYVILNEIVENRTHIVKWESARIMCSNE
jgi:hypothetical protein